MGNEFAGPGEVFVCGACGKRSADLYGEKAISYGWDESCMLNAILCREDHLVFNNAGTMVIQVRDGGMIKDNNPPEELDSYIKKTDEYIKNIFKQWRGKESDAS